jgi:hypothetical protein
MADRTWTGTTNGNWGTSTNWLEGSVPVSGDDVFFLSNNVEVTAGLNQSAVTLNSLSIDSTYTGKIGASGIAGAYLQIGTATCNIGRAGASGQVGDHSLRLNLDFGASTVAVNIYGTASTAYDTGEPPVRLKGSGISQLNVGDGTVGVATHPTETATVTALRVAQNSTSASPLVFTGRGATVTTWDVKAGEVHDYSDGNSTTITVAGGDFTRHGDGDVGMLNVRAGTVHWNGIGDITDSNVRGTIDFTRDPRAKTVDGCTVVPGAIIDADNGNPLSITFTNGILCESCNLDDVTIRTSRHVTVSFA